jgi:protein SCO1/2
MRAWLVSTLVAVVVLGACSAPSDESFRATDITGAEFARKLELTGHDGKARTLSDFKGKVTVVFFGFTHCPDVCPTTLSKLAEVAKRLGADAERLQVLFVTVDPQRDTTAAMKQYVDAFGGGITGLTGTEDALEPLLSNLGVVHSIQPLAGDDYTVDHSATVYYLNARGEFAAVFTPPFDYAAMRSDLAKLLASNY